MTAPTVYAAWAACAEGYLSAHGNRGGTPHFSAVHSGEIFEKIVRIFLCRINRHKGVCRKQVEIWLLRLDLTRHSCVGFSGQVG